MISVVIPTYNEAGAIEQTLRRSAAALQAAGEDFELIVVDDSSSDGTAEIAEKLGGVLPIRVLRRPGRLGLATAVIDGWQMARGDLLAVMDADLQHPPEVLRPLAEALRDPAHDIALQRRIYAAISSLPDHVKTIHALEKRIAALEEQLAARVAPPAQP